MAWIGEKNDELLRSVQALQRSQTANQKEMARRLDQLEKEVTSSQDEATWVSKRMRHDRVPKFEKKGHENNFVEDVKDHVRAASDLLSKVKPASTQELVNIQAAKEELEAGI